MPREHGIVIRRKYQSFFANQNPTQQNAVPITTNCPNSTPILNETRDNINLFSGKANFRRASAKPIPCNKPKVNITINLYF